MNTRAGLFSLAIAFSIMAGGHATAQRETLAIVVPGLDSPYFSTMGNGCAKWNEQHPDGEFECLYTGPAMTSDEAGEIQIVADLIARDDVSGIAIAPSNAPAMAKLLAEKAADIAAKEIAIMTIDADLLPADRNLRTTYFGPDNYSMGVAFCEWLKKLRPNGGNVALMFGNPAAENMNERGYGFRDCIKGEVLTASTTKSRDPLTGEGGWTEVATTYANGDVATAYQQFADVFAANPDLNAYVLLEGHAPPGYSQVKIGQRPYEMGYRSPDILIGISNGEPIDNLIYTGLSECPPECEMGNCPESIIVLAADDDDCCDEDENCPEN